MPNNDELYQLTFTWLTIAWRWIRDGRRDEAALFLGVDAHCADALEHMTVARLAALARSGAITFRPRASSSFWQFVAGTDDDDTALRYMILNAENARMPPEVARQRPSPPERPRGDRGAERRGW